MVKKAMYQKILQLKLQGYPQTVIAEKLNIDPKECIYIGDQDCDIKAANAAGMTSCLFKGPYTPEGIDGEADVVIDELSELLEILSPLSRSSIFANCK